MSYSVNNGTEGFLNNGHSLDNDSEDDKDKVMFKERLG